MSLNAKLVVVGGEVKTAEIKLRLPSTIGRGRGATIMLPHPLVSRQHCELFEESGKLMVRDLGSLNGTFVNNERIAGDASLPPGELLTVGAVTFRAMYEAEEAAMPPDGPSPHAKTVVSEATRTVTTGGSSKAGKPKAQPAPKMLEEDDDNAEFNFDEPLVAKTEDEEAGDTATPIAATPKTDATTEDINAKPVAKPAAKAPPKPAATPTKPTEVAKPAAGKAAPTKPAAPAAPAKPVSPAKPGNDEETADISSKWKDDDEEPEKGKDDEDDFGDFLKSLNK